MKQNVPARRILLAVTGLSPQVITETLYALAVCHEPMWVPTEIHLITTVQGATRARLALLSEDPAWFERLLEDYKLPSITFEEKHIHVLEDEKGQPLEDIRRPEDNERAADAITALVQAFTSDPESALHVSIAGGRKTMGYYLGYALSLFGRPQDRLSHVLVSEPFESCWDFFYPTPYSKVIQTRNGNLVDTREARVTLAEIPFVRLRGGLPKRLQSGNVSFSQAVASAQKAQLPPQLLVDMAGRRIEVVDESVDMAPADLAFFAMMTRRSLGRKAFIRWDDEGLADDYLAEYVWLAGRDSGDYERAENALASDDLKEWFEQRKSRTNAAIKAALGEVLAAPYLISSAGKRPHTRYGINLAPDAIRFRDVGGKLAADTIRRSLSDNESGNEF